MVFRRSPLEGLRFYTGFHKGSIGGFRVLYRFLNLDNGLHLCALGFYMGV